MRLSTPEDNWVKAKRLRAADRQGWLCHWCGVLMTTVKNSPMEVTIDEIVPKHMGGVAKPGNFVAAHRRCNESRHPEMEKRKASEPLLVATTGETETESPFAILRRLK
jgi:hypothetical protein